MKTFADLNLDADLLDILERQGITAPFPIQEQTIPLALTGQDIIGQAQTGTGKTLSFGLPLLQRLGGAARPVSALVVVPTRELCLQVADDLQRLCYQRGLLVVTIYGGSPQAKQVEELEKGAQIVVGTPGRLLDLMGQRLLDLGQVQELVLDEADRILDLGFLPEVERLLAAIPAKRHTMLFSATMPSKIVSLARRYMERPLHIRAVSEKKAQESIRHLVYRTHPLDKEELVSRILHAEGRGKSVIFTRTKREASRIFEALKDRGFSVAAVHGDMTQSSRELSMKSFRSGRKEILVATDVASRGIDVEEVTHVVNYSMPEDEHIYLHRVGRTGRAHLTGTAITLVNWDDLPRWRLINQALSLGVEDPAETYSSSPHLFSDLSIDRSPEQFSALWRPQKENTKESTATRKPARPRHSGQNPVRQRRRRTNTR